MRDRWRDVEDGDVLAWSTHITGQSTTDMNDFDKFRSVAVVKGSSDKECGDARYDDELWVVVDRTIDGNDYKFIEQFQPLNWGDDADYCYFVDCGGRTRSAWVGEVAAVEEVPEIPAVPATYKFTYISENANIWGFPVGDSEMNSLDSADAVNVGGGVVGLPWTGHPFTIGETIQITGTTNYNGAFTVGGGTTANQVQITDTYVAETFDGTEVLVKHIGSLQSGAGHMVQDTSGNLYYGHILDSVNDPNNYYVTKIATDGTITYDYQWLNFNWTTGFGKQIVGLAMSSDDAYMYYFRVVASPNYGYVIKINMSTGLKEWETSAVYGLTTWPGYDMAIDADGNAYAIYLAGESVIKCASEDGAITEIDLYAAAGAYGGYPYEIEVNDTHGKIIVAGRQYCTVNYDPNDIYNMCICDLDGSNQIPVQVGGYYTNVIYYTPIIGTGHVVTDDDYIYVLTYKNNTTPTVFKYDFEGNLIVEGTVSDYAVGLYIDLYGNIVVVNQDWYKTQADRLYFYDKDINYISKSDNHYTLSLHSWDASAGGSWVQGNVVFDGNEFLGTPGTPAVPAVPAVPAHWDTLEGYMPTEVCVYADGVPMGTFDVNSSDANDILGLDDDSYTTIIAGINYYSIYESFPINLAYGPGWTSGFYSSINNVKIDFYESMGCNVGVSIDDSVDWQFSYDDFATSIEPLSEIKTAPFVWGTTREPIIFLYIWRPVPLTIRAIIPCVNISMD